MLEKGDLNLERIRTDNGTNGTPKEETQFMSCPVLICLYYFLTISRCSSPVQLLNTTEKRSIPKFNLTVIIPVPDYSTEIRN
jgi:hypothetical protein